MPPPPPPSKSYLLNFDYLTDSDDDEHVPSYWKTNGTDNAITEATKMSQKQASTLPQATPSSISLKDFIKDVSNLNVSTVSSSDFVNNNNNSTTNDAIVSSIDTIHRISDEEDDDDDYDECRHFENDISKDDDDVQNETQKKRKKKKSKKKKKKKTKSPETTTTETNETTANSDEDLVISSSASTVTVTSTNMDADELDNMVDQFEVDVESSVPTENLSAVATIASVVNSNLIVKARPVKVDVSTLVKVRRASHNRHVSFTSVTVIEFDRCFGYDVVPHDGGWPLGLTLVPVDGTPRHFVQVEEKKNNKSMQNQSTNSSKKRKNNNKNNSNTIITRKVLTFGDPIVMDDYEKQRQVILSDRIEILKANNGIDENDTKLSSPYETRQWDYRRKCKNPLFRVLTEKERMNILISHSSPYDESSTDKNNNKQGNVNRNRSGSFSDTIAATTARNGTSSKGGAGGGRGPSGSFSSKDDHHHNSKNNHTSSEIYNDTFTQVDVHAIRNELERIRNNRSCEDGALGCTCRKLNVYIPPPNVPGVGGTNGTTVTGKKSNNRRMKIEKVKLELKKRHILPLEPKSREELELLLHAAVEAEPCCSAGSDDCPCYRNGIGCQADTCQCWYLSHQTIEYQKKVKSGNTVHTSADAYPPVIDIQNRCGSRFGMYSVDVNAIDNYRLTKYTYCQVLAT